VNGENFSSIQWLELKKLITKGSIFKKKENKEKRRRK